MVAGACTLSALTTWSAIRYARHRGLVDLPGRRRSHAAVTPRGGGIGIALAAIFVCLGAYHVLGEGNDPLRLVFALTLVAAAGWADDHYGLGALPRIAVHAFACAVFLAPWLTKLFSGGEDGVSAVMIGAAFCIAWLACVWSINLHNFMDGINGLLAAQAVFVCTALGVLCLASSAQHALVLFAWAAAVLGFLPFNFPRARIFMGDVGSGVLGLVIAIAILSEGRALAATTGLVLCSAFVADATCTLLSRMLRGRRWYSAHREHLYQWLVRAGLSHAKVVALYMSWNLLIALPAVLWMNRVAQNTMSNEIVPAIGVYGLATGAWWLGKRWCLRRVANGGRHAAA